ncbi:MAG: N-acetyltransferase [Endomicrobiales bacterium]|nr:N-acetyltransferase [Endomicrobiales bacterium]
MIRKYKSGDIERVLDIWLQASMEAHGFVKEEFWRSQIDNMKNIYLPASENYVYEIESEIVGFYALNKNTLAAIFVFPKNQGKGIGKQLINHAKGQRDFLELTVYKENKDSYNFYISQGFQVIKEQIDEHTGHIEILMKYGI